MELVYGSDNSPPSVLSWPVPVPLDRIDDVAANFEEMIKRSFQEDSINFGYVIIIVPLVESDDVLLAARLDENSFGRVILGLEGVELERYITDHTFVDPKRKYLPKKCGSSYGKHIQPEDGCRPFYLWFVDTQERPCFGVNEIDASGFQRKAKNRQELAPGELRIRLEAIYQVLRDASVEPALCSVCYNMGSWARTKQAFHLKCFVPPDLYFDKILECLPGENAERQAIATALRDHWSDSSIKEVYRIRFSDTNRNVEAVIAMMKSQKRPQRFSVPETSFRGQARLSEPSRAGCRGRGSSEPWRRGGHRGSGRGKRSSASHGRCVGVGGERGVGNLSAGGQIFHRDDMMRSGGGTAGKRMHGTVSRWNKRGFGSIRPDDGPDDGSGDVFCNLSCILDGDWLHENDTVEFEKVYDDRLDKFLAKDIKGGVKRAV